MTAPLIADAGSPILVGDWDSLIDVLAKLGWSSTYSPRNAHGTYTDPGGRSLTAHVSDAWALLVRRGLIRHASIPYCPTCGYLTGDDGRRPCQCWRLAELPA